MASFSNKIVTTIEVLSDKSAASLKGFRQSIQEADGASAKLKTGFGQAGDFIKANAAGLAAAAGTALIGFAAKSVAAFQDVALESGKMADTLGISSESASRWVEVAGDIGASTEDVTKSMARMEREVAKNPAQFDELGVSIARTATGAVDANETFLRTIEALKKIEDPTKRQEAANKLLGKSWGNIAELVNGDVREAFNSVSDAKLIDQEEVDQAREFRDAWDELKGKLEDFALSVGGEVVPALTKLMDFSSDVGEAFEPVGGALSAAWGALETAFGDSSEFTEELIAEAERSKEAAEGTGIAAEAAASRWLGLARRYQGIERDAGPAAEAILATGDAAKEADRKLEELNEEWDQLTGRLTNQGAWNRIEDSFEDVGRAGVEAMRAADEAAKLTTEAMKDGSAETAAAAEEAWQRAGDASNSARDAVLNNKEAVVDYAREVLGLPVERTTQIIAMLDAGEVQRVEDMLTILTRNRNISVDIIARGGAGFDGGRFGGARAAGGPTSKGSYYSVVERNKPELYEENGTTYLLPGGNGQVTPMSPASGVGMGSGGAAPTINIYANVIEKDTARWIVEQIAKARTTMGAATVQRAVNG